MRAARPGTPWLARTAALLRGRMLLCHCAPAVPACGTALAGRMLVCMRNLCTISLVCTCRAGVYNIAAPLSLLSQHIICAVSSVGVLQQNTE